MEPDSRLKRGHSLLSAFSVSMATEPVREHLKMSLSTETSHIPSHLTATALEPPPKSFLTLEVGGWINDPGWTTPPPKSRKLKLCLLVQPAYHWDVLLEWVGWGTGISFMLGQALRVGGKPTLEPRSSWLSFLKLSGGWTASLLRPRIQ